MLSGLHTVVNNAGVMTIGDYEWQTPSMIENTVNVNLLGPMRVISTLLPLLRISVIEVSLSTNGTRYQNVNIVGSLRIFSISYHKLSE